MSSGIRWTGSNGDYTAKAGEYILNVFNSKWSHDWVWRIYPYNDSTAVISGGGYSNILSAKEAVEKAYKEHVNV